MEIRFKLNPKNKKDKVIIELLGGEYNSTDFIKSLIYKVAAGGTQWISMSFGGYVNVSNSFPSTPQTDILGIQSDDNGTPTNYDIGIESDNNTTVDDDILDFFN